MDQHQSESSTPDPTPQQDAANEQATEKQSGSDKTNGDRSQEKALGIVGYILPILFFLPLITDARHSEFARFHANQQLNLLLFWVIGEVVSWVLVFVLIGYLLMPIVFIMGVVFMILGIINVANEKQKPLPLIGGFSLID